METVPIALQGKWSAVYINFKPAASIWHQLEKLMGCWAAGFDVKSCPFCDTAPGTQRFTWITCAMLFRGWFVASG